MSCFRISRRISWAASCALGGSLLLGQISTVHFTVAPGGASGLIPDDIHLNPVPSVVTPGAGAGFNVNAFSYSRPLWQWQALEEDPLFILAFSVDPTSTGAPGTSVNTESSIPLNDAPADIFGTALMGSNGLLIDGNGLPGGPPLLGLVEPWGGLPLGDDVDGLETQTTVPPQAIFYSIDIATAGPAGLSSNDIYVGPPLAGYDGAPPVPYVTGAALGLIPGDDIDALIVFEDGQPGFQPGSDLIIFSLESTNSLGLSGADLLSSSGLNSANWIYPAGSLGLLASDDLDAMDVAIVPEPAGFAVAAGLLALGALVLRRGRRRS